ncbi:MAG: RNase adapter RapZ [Lachnospiraceae bacterium]|uniref:RNase adapter RapZ n=1 Tax=Candidatus Weimeria bifida TaxID=2599074 RepID=A0A6N7IZX5_9FIRM|nr:RNase adapter RapZ [Candidatus Weimeria bifida]RRF96455.1 MAG: RNase adapter RapZ [Lachnospiraceae bacterium]
MDLLIITGMSGAGKHTAFKILEDIGYNCVDNLPIPLFRSFASLASNSPNNDKVAVGIDVRSRTPISKLENILDELEGDGKKVQILFLDADDDTLVKRFKEERRTPPLADGGRTIDAIHRERDEMAFLKKRADYIVDTSHLLVRDLRAELTKIFEEGTNYKNLNITILSFGFKYGIPTDADLVFDVRFLPNPYYVDSLRHKTGNDQEIVDYVMNSDVSHKFIDKLTDLITFLIPEYIKEGKNELVICIGCTGGRHRSVTVARELYHALAKHDGDYGLRIEHRDIDKG